MNIALFGKNFTKDNLAHIQKLVSRIREVSDDFLCYSDYYKLLSAAFTLPKGIKVFSSHHDLKEKTDYLVSVGGDGTFLATLDLVRDSGIPVIGINIGRLGFLSSLPKEEGVKAINSLTDGTFTLEKRTLVKLVTAKNPFGKVNYALNEVTILKKESSMITVHAFVNDEFLNSYWADGLIVSTPTGSTAYSLSCDGPIVTPDSENFIINPIAPHNLNVRAMVLPDSAVVRLKVEARDGKFLAALDSRSATFDTEAEITVSKCRFKFNLVRLNDQNFMTMLRNKLLWGMDKRK